MDQIRKHFRYKLVKNVLTKEELELLKTYMVISHRLNDFSFEDKNGFMKAAETGFYGQPIMDSLLLNKCKLMEKHTGINLLPTYSYWRMYTKGSSLPFHNDRPACEVSVTINVGGDKVWPFIVNGKSFEIYPGDGLIYLGCELFHSREPYEGDWQAQIFLHYVDAEGKNVKQHKDGRQTFGMEVRPKNEI